MTARAIIATILAGVLLPAGCSSPRRLRQGGPTPYLRCLEGDAPAARTLRSGGAVFTVRERVLTVGKPARLRLGVFAGRGYGAPPAPELLARLAAAGADLLVMLGGLGDSQAHAAASARALAALPSPVVFVAGGRDRPSVWNAALDALPATQAERIIDATSLRELRIGKTTLIPIAGAPDGHYAVDDEACGFGAGDLQVIARELEPNESLRYLLSWAAPAGGPALVRGVDAGDPALSAFAKQVQTAGGLYAWPALLAGQPRFRPRLELVVPPWAGIAERADGFRVQPGFALLEVTAAGLALVP